MTKHKIRNIYDKETLHQKIEQEQLGRLTLSFYRYIPLKNVQQLRDDLFQSWSELNVLGRVYLAEEGVNAQISIPENSLNAFKAALDSLEFFADMPLKIAVEDSKFSFLKLIIKVRKHIVADGLKPEDYDVSNVGKHLTAEEFHGFIDDENSVVVDMRNHYEYEVGHFDNAIDLDVDTFRQALPEALEQLKGKEEKKILLYCTGGIRCEKASSYLRHHGFQDVNQLYGGIIEYAHHVKENNLESKFKGKNFVFDDRLGERITEDILSKCHNCGASSDKHKNCANDACHILFIQCEQCADELTNCCSEACKDIIELPIEEQKQLRKGNPAKGSHMAYKKGRIRPRLDEKGREF